MRLTTIRVNGGLSAGRVDGSEIVLLPAPDVGALLDRGTDWREIAASDSGRRIPVAEADFAPLIPQPEKVICVGANYRDHVEETGMEVPQHPTLFAKYARSLIGANDDIVLPACSSAVDWEVELGVVIGSPVRHADLDQAMAAVAGYTIVNDVSMRDWQLRTSQFLQGKTFESSTPVGPYLVTADEAGEPDGFRLSCLVDGEAMQEAGTDEMIFSVAEIISYMSQVVTLVPGDLIATGTPAGIGAIRKPPRLLTPGARLESSIDGLGSQVNLCVAETVAAA